MKVVFDTNVYIAEALGGDTAAQIIACTERASWRAYISQHILDDVMTDDLNLSRRSATLAVMRALRRAQLVEPILSRHHVPGDAQDSDVLRTAIRSGADYLVTNDRHLLTLHPYEGIHIVTMAEYRKTLETQGLLG